MENELISNIEHEASLRGLSINELCRLAKVARSTFTRAKSGTTNFNMATYQRIQNALKDLPAKK